MASDITGMKFGKLSVIRKTNKKPKDRYLWECICDCGNTVFHPANSITTGNTSSCGCSIYDEAWKIDLSSKRFGKLSVIKRGDIPTKWHCKCDCGNEIIVYGQSLLKGRVKSCGCLNNENIVNRNKKMATHRMSSSRLYGIWAKMKVRCTCMENSDYMNYGGRGISYFEDWSTFEPFMKWALNNGYEEHLTLERIDVNGNYEPSNCTWIEMFQQASNRRTSRYITLNGEKKTIAQWAKVIGITRQGLRYRLEEGWKIEDLLTESDQGKARVGKRQGARTKVILTINGITKTMLEWSKEIGINYSSLRDRVNNGWTEEELLLPKGTKRFK